MRSWSCLPAFAGVAWCLACTQDVALFVQPGDGGPNVDDSGATGAGGAGGQPAGDAGCEETFRRLPFVRQTAKVILALDRSASMFEQQLGAVKRIVAVQSALIPLLETFDRVIDFGYEAFPAPAATCGSGCCAGAVEVHPNVGAAEDIAPRLRCLDGAGCDERSKDSPAHEALARCRDYYDVATAGSAERYVLLITDGEPSCAAVEASFDPCLAAQANALELAGKGVATFVLGLGGELEGSACLAGIAKSGTRRGGRPSPTFYNVVSDERQMENALRSTFAALATQTCVLRLDSTPPPSYLGRVVVLIDGNPIPTDPVRGWSYDSWSPRYLNVHGEWCDKLKQRGDEAEVEVRLLCNSCKLPRAGCE